MSLKKMLQSPEEYEYLNNKCHSLFESFENTTTEIENLLANSDLMTKGQFERLMKLQKEYRDKFLSIVREMAENKSESL